MGQIKTKVIEHWITNEGGRNFSWNNHKMRKNVVKLYVHCSWGRWLLRVEDQSQRKDETLQGTKCEILLGLASFLFTLIWKIKGRYNQSNQMKAQCKEEMAII